MTLWPQAKTRTVLGIGALVALLASSAAHANLVNNGNFGSTCGDPNFCTYSAGDSTDIPSWTVTQGSIDLITGYWQAPPGGGNSIDLDGFFQRGGVASTSFGTTTGAAYQLTFELSGNPDGAQFGANPIKTVEVQVGNQIQTFTFDTSANGGNSRSDMKWVKETLNFVALGALTSLSFTSLDDIQSAFGPVIGNIDVELIPEPGTLALFGVSLLLLGAYRRRRSTS